MKGLVSAYQQTHWISSVVVRDVFISGHPQIALIFDRMSQSQRASFSKNVLEFQKGFIEYLNSKGFKPKKKLRWWF